MSDLLCVVNETSRVPTPAELAGWRVEVYDATGDFANRVEEGGPYEVWLTIRPPAGHGDRRRIAFPFGFKTFEQGQRAGEALAAALALVKDISHEPAPDQSVCEHTSQRRERFSRLTPPQVTCEGCGLTLVQNVESSVTI